MIATSSFPAQIFELLINASTSGSRCGRSKSSAQDLPPFASGEHVNDLVFIPVNFFFSFT